MTCDELRQQLDAFADEQLPGELSREVERHVEACETCRARLTRLYRLSDLLNEQPVVPVPEAFAALVLGAARRQLAGAAERVPPVRQATPLRFTWADVAALVALLAGLSLGTRMARQTWATPESPGPTSRARIRPVEDINSFYGAASESDPSRLLPQIYLTFVDRSSSGE